MHSARRDLPPLGEIWGLLWVHFAMFGGLEVLAVVRAWRGQSGAPIIAVLASAYLTLISAAIFAMRAAVRPHVSPADVGGEAETSTPAAPPPRSRHRAASPRRIRRPARHREPATTGYAPS